MKNKPKINLKYIEVANTDELDLENDVEYKTEFIQSVIVFSFRNNEGANNGSRDNTKQNQSNKHIKSPAFLI